MASLKELKTQFLEYMEIEKGAALRTVENYDHYISRYLEFAKPQSPKDITPDSVREFRLWLNRQKVGTDGATMSRKTQNYYLIALRVFLKYLGRRGIQSLPADQIELARTRERPLDLITPAELERLLEAPRGEDLKSLRDRAILELLFSTGLRVSELCSLPRDIALEAEEMSIRGKGGKMRVVFISPRARAALKKYMEKRQDMEDGLFIRLGRETKREGSEEKKSVSARNEKKKRYTGKDYGNLDRRSVERIVRRYATLTGISKKVTPHVLRHMFATDLLSNGADIRSVQALLGHSSISTTQVYTHVTDPHLREVHKKFHNRK